MTNKKRLISIVVPVYNEERNLPELYDALKNCIKQLPYQFELIFVDDDSTDGSTSLLRGIAREDKRVRILELSRNFGKEAALSAGLHVAKGDAVLSIDADMQMPVDLIGTFIERWENGAEVAVGVFSSRNMSIFRKLSSSSYYRIMNMIAHTQITPHATDYRLLDRQVVDAFNDLNEHNRMARGLIDWMGFRRSYIPFEQAPRLYGKPTYNLRRLIKLAIDSFTAFSLAPLKVAGYLGVLILLISIPLGLAMFVGKYIIHWPTAESIRGTAFVAVLLLFLVGMILACLGLMSLYIAHIYDEVLDRPLYLVRRAPKRLEQDNAGED